MAIEILSFEYKQHAEHLKKHALAGVAAKLRNLAKVLGPTGPERNHASELDQLRTQMMKSDEADNILAAAGLALGAKTPPTEQAVSLAASLKFLRHLYLVSERGNQQVWVLSIPKNYTHYPLRQLQAVKSKAALMKATLRQQEEQFCAETRGKLGQAMMLGLAWCERAKMVLSTVKTDPRSKELVMRWLCDASISDSAFENLVSKVHAGFKKIAHSLNTHQVIITDMPSLRNDPHYEFYEAFSIVYGANEVEVPKTIYIEKALLENYEISVLHDMKKNWARVLIHECSHIEARTKDLGYAVDGIRPGTDMPAAFAGDNADSWAFFAADCAGALTDGERIRAGGGTYGRRAKMEKNWN
jgi:hypothetical protein